MKKRNLSISKEFAALWVFALLLLQACTLQAYSDRPGTLPYASSNEDIVTVALFTEEKSIRPASTFWVCFQFHIAPEWHLYWKNPGDAGAAPEIDWTLPEGFKAGNALWPFPESFDIDNAVVYGYAKQLLLLVPISTPEHLTVGQKVKLGAKVQWLGCSSLCVPGNALFSLQLPVAAGAQEPNLSAKNIFNQAKMMLPVESKLTEASIRGDNLEIQVQSLVPIRQVMSVHFFPEEADRISTHAKPTYSVNDIGTISVQVPLLSRLLPIKGVLVVQDNGPEGIKKHAWQVTVGGQIGEKEIAKTNNMQLEALEKQVWYRRILVAVSEYMHSDLAQILLFAFLGGILLNVMPCVLPVVSLKMLHLVELKGADRYAIVKNGLSYSCGVIVSFWALAGSIYLLQFFGKVVGWGFQLQNPYFVAALVLVLFILSLGMFGVFEFGVGISSSFGGLDQRVQTKTPSLFASFLSGVLATFIASPCTGPLLGSAIGFAATVQPLFSFLIFTSLGIGMAFPFLLLSVFPGMARILPRPGRWMVTFKQLMGFFLMATVLWLVWVLDAETEGLSPLTMLLTLFIVSVGAWVYGTWGSLDRVKATRTFARIVALALIVWGSYTLIMDIKRARIGAHAEVALSGGWEPFSQNKLDAYLQQRVPVFVDVTAKWCLTCQANRAVLETETVRGAFRRYGVHQLLADWTNGDEEITAYLRSLGRNGVPCYVIYPKAAGAAPIILPEVITPEIVVNALNRAYGP